MSRTHSSSESAVCFGKLEHTCNEELIQDKQMGIQHHLLGLGARCESLQCRPLKMSSVLSFPFLG